MRANSPSVLGRNRVRLPLVSIGTRSSTPDRTKTSESSYRGTPSDVLRATFGTLTVHPRPNGLLPLPVLYARLSEGASRFLPGGSRIGIVKFPVPVKRS